MSALLAGVSAIAVTGLGYVLIPIELKILAKRDWFFTLAEEMKGLVVVRGNAFHHAILASDSHHLNIPGTSHFDVDAPAWEVLPNTDPDVNYDTRSPLAKQFGGYWVGVPWFTKIYKYKFGWNEISEDDKGKMRLRPRPGEVTRYWFAKDFTYLIMIDDLNTEEGLPISMLYSMTVRITNPQKALFFIEDWLRLLQSVTNPLVREFAAKLTWEQLRKAGDEKGGDYAHSFNALITSVSDKFAEEIEAEKYVTGTKGRYGVTIVKAGFQDPQLTGDAAKQHEESATARFTAEKRKEATVIDSEATAAATLNTGTAEATVISLKGKADADALDQLLTAAAKQPDIARERIRAQAIATPGDGKVVIDLGGTIGKLTDVLTGRSKGE